MNWQDYVDVGVAEPQQRTTQAPDPSTAPSQPQHQDHTTLLSSLLLALYRRLGRLSFSLAVSRRRGLLGRPLRRRLRLGQPILVLRGRVRWIC